MKDLPPAFRSIASGGELCEALVEAFARHRGWVQATGFVDDVELRLGADGADERRTFRGRFALVQLGGPLGGPYGVTLSRAVGERVEVLAGVLVRARSAGVSAVCVAAGDSLPRAGQDSSDDKAPLRHAPEAVLAKRPLTSAFAARVGVSDSAEEGADDAVLPEAGDWVEHFAFGRCEVLSVAGDRLVLRDLSRAGRIREIASERLSITGPVEQEGHRLFRLARR